MYNDHSKVEKLQEFDIKKEQHLYLASFCNELPICLRPLSSWVILGTYYTITIPFFYLTNSSLFDHSQQENQYKNIQKTKLPFEITSNAVTAFIYILIFCCLQLMLPSPFGYIAGFSFAIIPMIINPVGLTHYDPFAILYWPLLIVLILNIKKFGEKYNLLQFNLSKSQINILFFILAIISTWLMENLGIALTSTLLILYLLRKYILINLPFGNLFLASSTATLFSLIIGLLLTHRHEDVFWINSGSGISALWDVYSKFDSFYWLFRYLLKIILGPLIVLTLSIPLIYLVENKQTFSKKLSSYCWISGASMFGFLVTVILGRWLGAGYSSEWQRQLIPFGILFVMFFLSLEILIINKIKFMIKKKREYKKNSLIKLFERRIDNV